MTSSDLTRGSLAAATAPDGRQRTVVVWLLTCCAMILAMSVIGAITRLTESGLSIMEWAPISGTLPPLSEAEWQRVFAIYKTIPEYTQENAGMSLEEFKTIFWWEWIHRLWGRLIGVVFALPFFWLLLRRRIERRLVPHLWFALLLGGLQGGMGWFMVASGFGDRTDVSQYRLVAHLMLALLIYGYLLWLALAIMVPPAERADEAAGRGLRGPLNLLIALVSVTIASGGLVAGINAGFIYNTFPLMDGALIPEGYGELEPYLLNWSENLAAVQFNHRLLAVVTVALALLLWLIGRGRALGRRGHQAFLLLGAMALAQFGLGVATLLLVVPIWLGALHQGGAILLLSFALYARLCLAPGRAAA
jgi:cytochrome c oxidase assembly protein subunit 15